LSIRSLALTGLLLIAIVLILRMAAVVFVPLALAIVLSFLLAPLVSFLAKLRIPNSIGAAIVLVTLTAGVVVGVYHLSGPTSDWMDRLPHQMRQFEYKLRGVQGPIDQVKEAAETAEEMADGDDESATKVEIENGSFPTTIVQSGGSVVAMAFFVIILLYFLLASGDRFPRKLVQIQQSRAHRRRAAEIIRCVQTDITTYLTTIAIINAGLGVAVGGALWLLGMPNPILWGVVAMTLNYVPYAGAVVGVIVVGLVAVVTFDSPLRMLLPPASYVALNAFEAYVLTPMIVGNRLRLNPLVILVGLVFWYWLWGITGAVLAVPLLAIGKIVCDRVPSAKPVGTLLGR
jgi:predicted PurR-regulated permease PerM